jgi:hypothetical protein
VLLASFLSRRREKGKSFVGVALHARTSSINTGNVLVLGAIGLTAVTNSSYFLAEEHRFRRCTVTPLLNSWSNCSLYSLLVRLESCLFVCVCARDEHVVKMVGFNVGFPLSLCFSWLGALAFFF